MPKDQKQEKKEVLLAIADISGYTQFVLKNDKDFEHAQTIISELMRALLAEIKKPFRVVEVEGDAVFFYAEEDLEESWNKVKEKMHPVLRGLFDAFEIRRDMLSAPSTCTCNACHSLKDLRLKVVLHAGPALVGKIGKFHKVSGPNTIIVHKLLKNSVPYDKYVLLTKAVAELLAPLPLERMEEHREEDKDFGVLELLYWAPEAEEKKQGKERNRSSRAALIAMGVPAYIRMLLHGLGLKLGVAKPKLKEHLKSQTS